MHFYFKHGAETAYSVRNEFQKIPVGTSRRRSSPRRNRHHRSDTGCWHTHWYLATQNTDSDIDMRPIRIY